MTREAARRGVFTANMTGLKPGEYRASLAVPVVERPPTVTFRVLRPPGELSELTVPRAELAAAAAATGGRSYTPEEATAALLDDLPVGDRVPVRALAPEPEWNRWPYVLLVLSLLIAEWTLRRVVGLD